MLSLEGAAAAAMASTGRAKPFGVASARVSTRASAPYEHESGAAPRTWSSSQPGRTSPMPCSRRPSSRFRLSSRRRVVDRFLKNFSELLAYLICFLH